MVENQALAEARAGTGGGKAERSFVAALIFLAFMCVIAMGEFIFMANRAGAPPESRWVFQFIAFVQGAFLAAIVAGLICRARFPQHRRVITMALSVILLLHVPFGTAIGLYGLAKVDKAAGE